ncbi:helix-turn-helix domain-containing protein [Streptomyces roseoverticillatus]|nr:helix-turn-helix domain-containing protein [Streptomyces roseoverticillatus]
MRPGGVGLPTCGRRRVAGLRREEGAVPAGMNSDYYARLEQGREQNPSPQISDAISDALRMDHQARDHLYRLADTLPDGHRTHLRETVSPMLNQLPSGYANTPAFVLNPALDFLAANSLADALFSPFERVDNLARMTFLDPAGRSFYAQVGSLSLTYISFDVLGAPGQQVVIYHAEPASPSSRALLLLGSLDATRRRDEAYGPPCGTRGAASPGQAVT